MSDIIVLGSLNMDMVVRVPHLPKPGETVLGGNLKYVCGGKGGNQAYTLAKIGASVAMLGSVGNDENGNKLIQNLERVGVDSRYIQRLDGANSGLALISVEDKGDNSIIVVSGANLLSGISYVEKHAHMIESSKALVMQLEIPIETVCYAAKTAKRHGKLVVLDPAPAAELPAGLYANIDILKPNEIELAHLSGCKVESLDDAKKAAEELLKRGVGQVVTTLGEHGALIVSRSQCLHIPIGEKVKVVDTTAAGDSFTAAMTMMLIKGHSIDKAVEFAIAISKIVVSRPGAQTSIPDAQEILHLCEAS